MGTVGTNCMVSVDEAPTTSELLTIEHELREFESYPINILACASAPVVFDM